MREVIKIGKTFREQSRPGELKICRVKCKLSVQDLLTNVDILKDNIKGRQNISLQNVYLKLNGLGLVLTLMLNISEKDKKFHLALRIRP